MPPEPDIHYFCKPNGGSIPDSAVAFVNVSDFLFDEPACNVFWQLIDSQFRTRSKFLAIWRCVSFVAVHRNADGRADGFLLVSAPVNWQIDYVVVHPDSRGRGIASKLIEQTLGRAAELRVPYVMLTSNASLRGMYEGCGFRAISESV